jgi:protoporphyrinogen oxidase
LKPKKATDINQKGTETSLIERFLYPKYGPGQIWEEVAHIVAQKSEQPIRMQSEVVKIYRKENTIYKVDIKNTQTGVIESLECDYFFSTMPIKQFVNAVTPPLPPTITEIGDGLLYRDFLTVGLLLHKLKIKDNPNLPEGNNNLVKDNWIYIQEKDVKVGRLQIFNNWSPYMVANPDHVWIGMEYFCNEGDELWNMEDEALKKFAIAELAKIDIIHQEDVIDSTVLRMEKAYPAYFGTYDRFDELKGHLNQLDNAYFIGRNGMHRYNNSDHSMLTAMYAVESLMANNLNKEKIWDVNTEQEYHEEK